MLITRSAFTKKKKGTIWKKKSSPPPWNNKQSDLVFKIWIRTLDIFSWSFAGQIKIILCKLASNQPAPLSSLCISVRVVLCPLHETFWESLSLVCKNLDRHSSEEHSSVSSTGTISQWDPGRSALSQVLRHTEPSQSPLVKCCWAFKRSCSAAVSGFARGCVQSHSISDTASQGGCEWTPALTPEYRRSRSGLQI